MKSRLGFCMLFAIGLGLGACGNSNTDNRPHGRVDATTPRVRSSNFSTQNNDRDNDGDHNDDDGHVLNYGHAANAVDRRLSVALVTTYFAAAAAGNGAKSCTLLVPFIAESVAEDYDNTLGLSDGTCAVVMSKLFRQRHATLAAKNATLRVIGVRVEGDKALAVLEFPNIPEVRQITERRYGKSWRLQELFDGILE